MRVAMYYNNRDVRLKDIPLPKINSQELLVKVVASGICGSDVMEWYRIKKAPLVLGHEITGEIAEVGSKVKRFKVGQRVFVSHHVPCNDCYYCLHGFHTCCDTLHNTNFDPGGFSEYIRVPKINVDRGVFVLPDEISYEEGVFIEPLACVLRAQRLAGFKAGESILILGSGVSGLLHLLAARVKGANKIIVTDINPDRLKTARELGADLAINAKEDVAAGMRKINDNRLADLIIVCAASLSAFEQALQCVDRGGTVLFFAPTEPGVKFSINFSDFWRNGVTLTSSYGNAPLDAEEAIELMRTQKLPLKKLITHRLSLDDTGLGFRLVSEAKEGIKVIIEPQRKTPA